jgi:CheY-like chemotaxis protein
MDALGEIAMDTECITANSGFQALDYLKEIVPAPSLIFIDLNMPLMDGFECLKSIKNNERLKEIPVVIFTTSDNPADKKSSKELGAEIFFTKTANFKLLKTKLLEILETDFSELKNCV